MRDESGTAALARTGGRLRRELPDRTLLAVKCAVAAAAAWLVAQQVTSSPEPYYAPMTAFLVIQPTVAASLRDSAQYLAAAVLGTAVALGTHAVLAGGVLALAVTVGIAVLLGGSPGLGGQRVTVAFWALFVLVVGGSDPSGFAVQRMPEAALGVLVGVLVNVAAPPLLVEPAQERLQRLRDDLADVVQEMADDVEDDWPPDSPRWGGSVVQHLVDQAQAAVAQAGESLRGNLRGRRRRLDGSAQQAELRRLEDVALAVRALSGLLLDAAQDQDSALELAPDVRAPVATALAEAARHVRAGRRDPRTGGAPGETTSIHRLRADLAALHHQDPSQWVTEGTLVAQLERLDRALCTPSGDAPVSG